MADDGMLLNFELPADAFAAPKAKVKGGTWKDRLTARKSAEYGLKKAQERTTTAEPERPEVYKDAARPLKKRRTGGGDTLPKTTNGEVISSLFTFNPAAKVSLEQPETADDAPTEPSNAPLNDDETAKFTSLGLSAILANHLLRKLDIQAPTAIQRKAVKLLCSADTDAFIQAQTGSGKTLAYLLPIVERIAAISKRMKEAGRSFNRHSGLFAIILAPTRELSKQISTVLDKLLSCYNWIVSGTVIGGENKQSEKSRVRKGLNILVATPGRMADHINNTEALDLSNVRWLVLDEGDRLMEEGFEEEIQKIVSILNLRARKHHEESIPGLPDRRTTVLCSATIKPQVERLQSISLKNPVSIAVDVSEAEGAGPAENNFSAPAQLKQGYAIVPPKQRLVALVAVLKQAFKHKGNVTKCIVFISCADSVDFHFELLTQGDDKATAEPEVDTPKTGKSFKAPRKHGSIPQGNTISESKTQGRATAFSSKANEVQLFRLHGSLQQATRTKTLKSFAEETSPSVLVCTDVAARGLDLPNVDLVIEYDPPFSKDDHIHRIGRTARAGREGRAMIFLQPGSEEGYVDILKQSKPRNLTRHDADEILKKGFSIEKGVVTGSVHAGWEQRATDWQLEIEHWALENPKHLEQARRAYQSHIRAYATHIAAERHIFNMQELHLGHLAKAFALRDKPGSINVPGLRPGKDAGNKNKEQRRRDAAHSSSGGKRALDEDDTAAVDAAVARKKMFAKMRGLGGASEFNLG